MTMMVDSGLAQGLTPAKPGVSAAGGPAAPTGIAALFAGLMRGVADPGATVGATSPHVAANGDTALASAMQQVGESAAQPAIIDGAAQMASELTAYLDQLNKSIEPKKRDSVSIANVPSCTSVDIAELPTGEEADAGSNAQTPVAAAAVDPAIATIALPPAPATAPLVPAETLRSPPPPVSRKEIGAGSGPLASAAAAPASAVMMADAEAPPSSVDFAAAVDAFVQQQKGAGPAAKSTPAAAPQMEAVVSPDVSTKSKSEPSARESTASTPGFTPSTASTSGPAAQMASATPQFVAAAPTASDIGAMLGQQVIDMGADGQWIDGLAREIAALGKGEGQGSFRLSPEHLGPMRVDIRTGDQGANVTLTVETKAAEAMLVQDRHLLKADAQLSALRIGDVTVERVAQVAEVARSDSATGQGTSGQQGGQGQSAQNAALAQGHSQNQGNAQNHGQSPANRKVSDGATVSSEAEPRGSGDVMPADGARRARYA